MKTQKDVYINNIMNGVEFAFDSNTKDLSGVDLIDVIEGFIFRLKLFITENKNKAIKETFGKDFTQDEVDIILNAAKELYPEDIKDFENLETILKN